jgi:hypothetical protein
VVRKEFDSCVQFKKDKLSAGTWITPVIHATQEVAIRRTEIRSQTRQKNKSLRDPISKTLHKIGLARLKVKVPSSSPSTAKKKKKDKLSLCIEPLV